MESLQAAPGAGTLALDLQQAWARFWIAALCSAGILESASQKNQSSMMHPTATF
jgi:hypothetical protein